MHDAPQISPEHKHVTRDVVAQLPKVLLHDHLESGLRGLKGDPAAAIAALQSPEAVEQAVREACEDLLADGVVYAELRISPELYTEQGMTMRRAVDAAVAGLDVPGIDARLILTAMRHLDAVAEVAQLTVDTYGGADGPIVGFDLAGPEEGNALSEHAEALRLLRENWIPTTLHAGSQAGVESIAEAVQLGAVRLGHGVRVFDDFGVDLEGIRPGQVSSWIRDRHIALELCPSMEVRMGVSEQLADHPLVLLQQLGFTCTVNTGDRSERTLTDEFMDLVDTFDYGLEELFDITLKAIQNSFCDEETRQRILETQILPAYEELADDELTEPGEGAE
ncbi:adenosine deaminase family protein [Corynebacterium halotolerans]|uniref:adenosine deaminase n=1 Tax=Corynebacterium halotolerans YIM 70093 = DSM 44683 TaxID=1121362 RepID=M1NJS7_9CORY|nr:adenosine deaminase family protein [Corynebacterium halotolerans]AGF71653.1 adenosine deaminase [Corynebacterium halotolerans YIM 70093 = DSM 44683]